MTSTTPTQSRPHTPLRPPSRSSFRTSTATTYPTSAVTPLETLEPHFAELSDSLSVLEQNMLQLQLMNESLSRFNENFASFLYGLEMNAFVVDWPEGPLKESITRWQRRDRERIGGDGGDLTMLADRTRGRSGVGNETIMTSTAGSGGELDSTMISDTTFASLRQTPRRRTLGQDIGTTTGARGGGAGGRGGRGGTVKKSGIPARSGSSAASVARGSAVARGRGRGSATANRGQGTARTAG